MYKTSPPLGVRSAPRVGAAVNLSHAQVMREPVILERHVEAGPRVRLLHSLGDNVLAVNDRAPGVRSEDK